MHGTPFNMVDDGNATDDNNIDIAQPESFGDEYKEWLRMRGELPEEAPITVREPSMIPKPMPGIYRPEFSEDLIFDAGESDDLLDADLGEPLEVHEHDPKETFEESY